MTGWSTIELAVQAMQHGACDFITKPWDVGHLLEMFEKHLGSDRQPAGNGRAHATDLALARRIQRRLLPPQSLAAAGLQFDCAFLPFGDVGGDLYDFFEIEPGRVGFLLGDVCGKGLGAALLVATLQATIRSQLDLARNPSILLTRVNQQFFKATRPEHFATLFFGVYEANTRQVRYVNCGHPSGVLLNRNGGFEILEPNGMILGAFEESRFEERAVDFEPGSRLILFSDGCSEAGVSNDGEEWTLDAILKLASKDSEKLAGALAAAAVARGEQDDDITVMEVHHLFG